jgi:hypothetical protein
LQLQSRQSGLDRDRFDVPADALERSAAGNDRAAGRFNIDGPETDPQLTAFINYHAA